MRYLTIIFCAVLVLFSLQQARATIIHVPGDSSTIQGGINGAVNGDTVLVAPGTYYEHINFNGKAILVTSEVGAESTTITKAYDGTSIVSFLSGEDTLSILDGFTITGGQADSGGGIYSNNSSPKIRNNVLIGNSAVRGGGFCCWTGHPVVEANIILNNTGSSGAGIYLRASDAYVRNNTIKENTSVVHGGGMFLRQCNGTTIEKNLFLSNSASGGRGGGVILSEGSNNVLVNNTIVDNSAGSSPGGGGVCIWFTHSNTVLNNIIVGSSDGYGVYLEASTNTVIEYNDVWNNSPGDYYGVDPGVGCISVDPLFCDPENGDYNLHRTSPCVGSGQDGANMGAFGVTCGFVTVSPGPDEAGQANTQLPVFFYIHNNQEWTDTFDLSVSDSLGWNIDPTYSEMTLDPDQVDSITVTVSIPDAMTGTVDRVTLTATFHADSIPLSQASLTVTVTPRTIYVPSEQPTIQAGIDASGPGDTVLVAPDTYYEHIFFNGKPILVKSEKGRDSTVIHKIAGGVSMVSFVSGEDSNSVLDGFTIRGAYLESGQGAGIRCQNSSPKILHNKIVNNSCPYGAGIDCDDYSSPLIANNLIEENTATTQGGGIRCDNHSSPVVLENIIIGNSAADTGAGICCLTDCSPAIIGNLIVDNTAQTGYGGGIALFSSSTVDITNNTIDRNSASYGGGIYIDNTPSATIVNTIVTNSLAGKGIRAAGPYPTIIYCDVWNNLDENYYGCLPGEGCISADPIFCNPANGNYYLWITSPCIGAGQDGADIGAFGVGCEIVGDANGDGVINVSDVVYLINYLFVPGSPAPNPLEAGDANCDGKVDVTDVVYLINYLFVGGPPPSC